MILGSGSRDLQTHQGKSWPGMHSVCIGVDSGVTAEKLMRHHVVSCKMSILAFPRAKFSTRVHLDLAAARIFRPTPRKNIWPNFVRSYSVRTWHTGLLLRSLVNAPCLDWSRFWRSRQEAHAVSCGILQKVDFGLPPCEIFHSSALGSSGHSDVSTDTTQKYLF